MSEVRAMDKAFNEVHGAEANLDDSTMKDPITITPGHIKRKCPDVDLKVINFFTKMKYHARIRALNEQDKMDTNADRKRKFIERNEKPRPAKGMRDYVKDGHFSNI